MVKGLSIKFKSYQETIPKLLQIAKLENELKKHSVIILKPCARNLNTPCTSPEFLEQILKYCLQNRHPETQVFIAEGSDGEDTFDMFAQLGYNKLAEKYSVGLIDLNTVETEEEINDKFLVFNSIHYPKILKNSLIISLPKITEDSETELSTSLANMLGAFPAKHYKGFLSSKKNKIRSEPIKYAIHDIVRCKLPDIAIIDASEKGAIFLGNPLEVDKQASKLFKGDWKNVSHLRLLEESLLPDIEAQARKKALLIQKQAAQTSISQA